ncbi:MAG: hypothetical protein QM820_58340 [Minicystis sp.]
MSNLLPFVRASSPSLALAAFIVGCGGSPPPTTTSTVEGTVRGESYSPGDAISAVVTKDDVTALTVFLSTEPSTCDIVKAHTATANARFIALTMFHFDASSVTGTAPQGPAVFTILGPNDSMPPADGNIASAFYFENDGDCQGQKQADAVSGTITLASIDGGASAGKADLELDTGDHLVVDFQATACGALSASGAGATSCD